MSASSRKATTSAFGGLQLVAMTMRRRGLARISDRLIGLPAAEAIYPCPRR